MGGEGAMMHANQSLKANRKLVGKRKENIFSFISTSIEKTEYNVPKSTPETIKWIKEKMKKENKIRRSKRIVLLAIISGILLSIFAYFI